MADTNSEILFADQWCNLQARIAADRIPHALLLSGPVGVGKKQFARRFAAALLCQQPADNRVACGHCSACHLIAAGSHGDYIEISPEEDSRVIKIHQIRSLCEELGLTAQLGGHRVAIIQPADVMHNAAANSLLKTLEEPRPGVVIVLVTAKLGSLPVTIRSRCQRMRLSVVGGVNAPEKTIEIDEFLEDWRSGLSVTGNYFGLAADWAKLDHEPVFRAIFDWTQSRTRLVFCATETDYAAAKQAKRTFFPEQAKMEQQQLFGFYEKLLAAYQFAARPGINRRALYEQLFIEARAMQQHSSEEVRAQ